MNALPARESQAWTNLVSALALFFTQNLAKTIGPKKMLLVALRNKGETNPEICHSHDFCDANEVMAEAFAALGLDSPASSEAVDPRLETDLCDLWELAWNKAKELIQK